MIDFHTGLGEYGRAEVILNVSPDDPQYERAIRIWGPEITRTTVTGDSVSTDLDASLKLAIPGMLPRAEVTAVSLEFGTVPILDVFKALRGENWLHHYGEVTDFRSEPFKACLLRAFHPGTEDWESAVLAQGRELVDQALASLAD